MTPKRLLHIQIPRSEERSPVEYGLFVEAFFFALSVSAEVENSPMPDHLDEVDQRLLQSGLRPTSALRAPLVGIMRLSERCQEDPQYRALLARCGALLDLLPRLPQDLILGGANSLGPHPVVFETAAEAHLNADFAFTPGPFLQEARCRLPKYPDVQQVLGGEALSALQARFPEALRNDLRSVRLFFGAGLPTLIVYRRRCRRPACLPLVGVPQRSGAETGALVANLALALRWLMETPLETFVRFDPEGRLFNPQTCKQD